MDASLFPAESLSPSGRLCEPEYMGSDTTGAQGALGGDSAKRDPKGEARGSERVKASPLGGVRADQDSKPSP